ncbi:microfibrillar-associated protein [Naegleria gruberi]|uniref:Microfibrillar-associated protein n=1 Tax=Naegleria gruberi TaxID=5762 RepID=D2V597_NAEGR|nr:microfibrillar-associated protein [Naegleria gruberi]EFC48236.1 microfibrillar-associated protein [Naegleria gruberi]|eukprot:XP_002680980.1 microfibrillar-associated protein [Naegleria gruberi strain NEG-M]
MKRLRKGQAPSIANNNSDSDDDGGVFASSTKNNQKQFTPQQVSKAISNITTKQQQPIAAIKPNTTTRVISKNNNEERRFESESSSSDEEDSDMEDRRARLRARLLSKQKEDASLNSLDAMLLGGASSTHSMNSSQVVKSEKDVSAPLIQEAKNKERMNESSDDEDLEIDRKKLKVVKKEDQSPVKSSTIQQSTHQNIPSNNQQHSITTQHHHKIESSDSSSSSSEEEDIRPVFISKNRRSTIKTDQELEEEENRQLELERKRQEQKREKSVKLLDKELENEANRKKAVKIDEDILSVNDSDDIDPNGEMMAWIEREMKRLSLIKQTRDESDKELQRRANNSSFKDSADKEGKSNSQNTEKPKFKTGQRYYHKGAFFMDDEEIAEKAAQVAHAPTGKDHINYDLLPKYYQTKNPGRARQPKYTNLKDQDTTDFSSPFYNSDRKNREKK